ncbi:MAG: OmpA family protein [Paludibacteraceae bacterium]|nr:OmpA family protein [Paludibacteraceae bacterium]
MTRHKPHLLLVALLMMAATIYAQTTDKSAPIIYTSLEGENAVVANEADTLPPDTLGVHPHRSTAPVATEESKVSLYLAAGGNLFDGDFTSEKKHAFYLPTVALGGAYHFNNTWALGLEYKFRNYKVFGQNTSEHAHTLLAGRSHQANGYLTFDVFNMFRPQNKHKLFSLDLILGAGAIWYKNQVYYPNEYKMDLHRDFVYLQHTKDQESLANDKFKCYAAFIGGASFEFNLNRSLQLGARVLYNYTTTDLVDGRTRGNNNDGMLDMEILLRYKIDAVKKSHTRNFRGEKALAAINAEAEKAKQPAVEEEEEVPELEDRRDTVYMFRRDTLYMIGQNGMGLGKLTGTIPGGYDETEVIPNPHYYYVVYFDNDNPTLDNMAMMIIQEASQRMLQDRNLYALIIGSCDNTGAIEYNKWLAVTRAANVEKEMNQMYGVDSTRMHTVGKGIIIDNRPEGSFRPNRRVEIHLLKKGEFEQAMQVYREFESNKQVKRGSAVRSKDENVQARSTRIEIIVPGDLDVANGDQITVRRNTTLQRLAQKYYNNPNCWVYIYLANGDTIKTTDQVPEGSEIILPLLTEAQRKVTVGEVGALLKMYIVEK